MLWFAIGLVVGVSIGVPIGIADHLREKRSWRREVRRWKHGNRRIR